MPKVLSCKYLILKKIFAIIIIENKEKRDNLKVKIRKINPNLNITSFNEVEPDYYDNVGGFHSPCNCYNPQGYFCGDCTKLTCENCSVRFFVPEKRKSLLDNYSYEELFDMTAGYDLAHRE